MPARRRWHTWQDFYGEKAVIASEAWQSSGTANGTWQDSYGEKAVIASEAWQSSGAASAMHGLLYWQRRGWIASLRSQ